MIIAVSAHDQDTARPMRCPAHDIDLLKQSTQYGTRRYCPVDGCTVVAWNGWTSTPADAQTRELRHRCHVAFDPLWRDRRGPFSTRDSNNSNNNRRGAAYRWLAKIIGVPFEQAHFGMFNAEQCSRALVAIDALRKARKDAI